VFVQFLDAVWQLLRHSPSEFGFSQELLLLLADHAQESALCVLLIDVGVDIANIT
jgi:hypothetical protein